MERTTPGNCVFNLYTGVPVNVLSKPQTQSLTPELLLSACKELRPSVVNTVPWIIEGLAELIASDAEAVRVVVRQPEILSYGGAALPSACSHILRTAGAKMMCTYGQTELGGPVLFGKPGGDPNALLPWVEHQLDRSVDDIKDEGELILFNNLSTTIGYMNGNSTPLEKPPTSYRTGDRFRRCIIDGRPDHLLYLCRKDDLIKHVTGEFTNPLVTEHEILSACIGVVHAACMVGNSHPRPWLLLELCEGIQASAGSANRIHAALKLANAKQPKYSAVAPKHVVIFQADSLPRTVKGTIRRNQAEANLSASENLDHMTLSYALRVAEPVRPTSFYIALRLLQCVSERRAEMNQVVQERTKNRLSHSNQSRKLTLGFVRHLQRCCPMRL